jgi:hypothetical protein
MKNPSEYVVGQVTAMSTFDAYWWLKIAKDMDAGKTGKGLRDPIRITTRSLPRQFAGGFITWQNLTVATIKPACCSSATRRPVSSRFSHCNAPGPVPRPFSGLVGSFSWAIIQSNTGLYTDLLNFFFHTVSSLVVLISRTGRPPILLAVGSTTIHSTGGKLPGFIIHLCCSSLSICLMRLQKQAAWILLAFARQPSPATC